MKVNKHEAFSHTASKIRISSTILQMFRSHYDVFTKLFKFKGNQVENLKYVHVIQKLFVCVCVIQCCMHFRSVCGAEGKKWLNGLLMISKAL